MLEVRRDCLYGETHDWLDNPDVIGWTFEGDSDHENSGAAVILSDHEAGEKNMYVGTIHAGETWIDRSGNVKEPVTIGSDGNAVFRCNGGSVSFYTKK